MWPILFDVGFIAVILWGIGLCAFEKYFYAFLTLVAIGVGAWFIQDSWAYAHVHAITLHSLFLKWIPIYLGVGVAVALVKWFFHVWKTASAIGDAKESFKNKSAADAPNPADRRKAFVDHYMSLSGYRGSGYSRGPDHVDTDGIPAKRWLEESIVAELLTPRAKKHMDRISFWVLEWPYVIIATIFDDILIKFARNVARFFDWAFTAASRVWIARVVKGI